MKKAFLLLGICLLAVSFVYDAAAQKKKPRIGIAGIQIENSVFMPNRQELVGRIVYLCPIGKSLSAVLSECRIISARIPLWDKPLLGFRL